MTELISTAQIQKEFKINRSTIYLATKNKKLEVVAQQEDYLEGRPGNLYRKSDVILFASQMQRRPQAIYKPPAGRLTLAEASKKIGKTPETLRNHVRRGLLVAELYGGNGTNQGGHRYEITPEDLEKYIKENGTKKTKPEIPIDMALPGERKPDCNEYDVCLSIAATENKCLVCEDCEKYKRNPMWIHKIWPQLLNIGR